MPIRTFVCFSFLWRQLTEVNQRVTLALNHSHSHCFFSLFMLEKTLSNVIPHTHSRPHTKKLRLSDFFYANLKLRKDNFPYSHALRHEGISKTRKTKKRWREGGEPGDKIQTRQTQDKHFLFLFVYWVDISCLLGGGLLAWLVGLWEINLKKKRNFLFSASKRFGCYLVGCLFLLLLFLNVGRLLLLFCCCCWFKSSFLK